MSTSGRSLWSLTVLCLLRERPMHPYEMQRLIRQRKNDVFLDLKRGSLYHAIARLQRLGLIEPVETQREGRRPERTVYRLTEEGEREVIAWLSELLAQPGRESLFFYAALSFIMHLKPEEARQRLDERTHRLEAEIAAIGAALEVMVPQIGRVVLLEVEYVRAQREAELAWVRRVLDDLRTGQLTWNRGAGCPTSPPTANGGDA